jgi:oligopeptide transport system permease protein
MKAIPGDPFSKEQSLSQETSQTLIKLYGLDQSWPQQYRKFLNSIIKGDLGTFKISIFDSQSVNSLFHT